jgi:uncharacterized protein with GYD domain
MASYILLGSFTDQGIRAVKDTTKRAETLQKIGKKAGVTLRDVFWTLGQYDVAAVLSAGDDADVTAFALSVAKLGNVRTQILRAFSAEEMAGILTKVG